MASLAVLVEQQVWRGDNEMQSGLCELGVPEGQLYRHAQRQLGIGPTQLRKVVWAGDRHSSQFIWEKGSSP